MHVNGIMILVLLVSCNGFSKRILIWHATWHGTGWQALRARAGRGCAHNILCGWGAGNGCEFEILRFGWNSGLARRGHTRQNVIGQGASVAPGMTHWSTGGGNDGGARVLIPSKALLTAPLRLFVDRILFLSCIFLRCSLVEGDPPRLVIQRRTNENEHERNRHFRKTRKRNMLN